MCYLFYLAHPIVKANVSSKPTVDSLTKSNKNKSNIQNSSIHSSKFFYEHSEHFAFYFCKPCKTCYMLDTAANTTILGN